MRSKLLIALALLATVMIPEVKATEPTDTIYNPPMFFTGMPKKYEIAGIRVSGLQNYEDYIVIGYSGLSVGDVVEIPGDAITSAAKRFWRQGLFSKIQIKVEKVCGDKAWLLFDLRQQPRISQINYNGVKKNEREELQQRLNLNPGNQITQNIVQRAKEIISSYFKQKGFGNVDVDITQSPDLSKENEMIVDINIDKNEKVKVHKIYINGNDVLSDNKIQRTMKKTNEKSKLLNLFRQKKFVEKDYETDLGLIIQKIQRAWLPRRQNPERQRDGLQRQPCRRAYRHRGGSEILYLQHFVGGQHHLPVVDSRRNPRNESRRCVQPETAQQAHP